MSNMFHVHSFCHDRNISHGCIFFAEDNNGTRTLIQYFIHVFLLRILLPVIDSNYKRMSMYPFTYSYSVFCFPLKIDILGVGQSTTPPPSSYGVFCFLLKISIVREPRSTIRFPSSYGVSCFQ